MGAWFAEIALTLENYRTESAELIKLLKSIARLFLNIMPSKKLLMHR